MMYRCSICDQASKPRQPRLTHAVLRADGSIQRELAVCQDCHAALAKGRTAAQLKAAFARALGPQPAALVTPRTAALADGDEL